MGGEDKLLEAIENGEAIEFVEEGVKMIAFKTMKVNLANCSAQRGFIYILNDPRLRRKRASVSIFFCEGLLRF